MRRLGLPTPRQGIRLLHLVAGHERLRHGVYVDAHVSAGRQKFAVALKRSANIAAGLCYHCYEAYIGDIVSLLRCPQGLMIGLYSHIKLCR